MHRIAGFYPGRNKKGRDFSLPVNATINMNSSSAFNCD
jgi:hypothetical protein